MDMTRLFRDAGGVILALMVCSAAFAEPQYYKWKDTDGAVHYSDAPPADRTALRVTVHGEHPPAASAQPPQAEPASSSSVGALDKAEQNYRKQSCLAAQNDLDTLSNGRLVVQGNDPSSATRMSDADRELAQKAAQSRVEQYCNGQ